eukprot:51733_1
MEDNDINIQIDDTIDNNNNKKIFRSNSDPNIALNCHKNGTNLNVKININVCKPLSVCQWDYPFELVECIINVLSQCSKLSVFAIRVLSELCNTLIANPIRTLPPHVFHTNNNKTHTQKPQKQIQKEKENDIENKDSKKTETDSQEQLIPKLTQYRSIQYLQEIMLRGITLNRTES